jgi:ABC-type Mn2+/Zn2+ transport system ATPase subunit
VHGVAGERALDARGVSVRYGAAVAVEDVSLAVEPGELVALVGPNGAGKSSLLRALLGLVPHAGEVVVHGHSATAAAFVPQRQAVDLDFPITVGQLVAAGRRPFRRLGRRAGRADRQAVARALARVGLDGLVRRPLGALSGGQAQRAFLARALAQEADVLLLDEPLASVDAATAEALVALFARLAADGAALVVTTHDLALVRERFVRCVALQRRVVGDGPPARVLGGAGLERLFAHG